MKKSLAALSAAVLGVVGIGATAAAPAEAATPACKTIEDHLSVHGSNPATAAYFAGCVPQYGLGKAELSISTSKSVTDFSLGDTNDVKAYSALTPTAASKYFTGSDVSGQVVGGSGSGKGPYQAPVVLDITKVAKVSKSALPTACKASTKHYDVIYQFSYAPVSVTFQTKAGTAQTYAGKPGSFSFSKSVPTLTVALNFKEGVASTDLEKRINTAAPICAVFAGHTEYAADSDASNYSYALYSALYAGPVSPAKPIELGTAALKAGLVKPVIVASATGKAGSATLTTTVKVGSVYQKGVVTVTVDGKRVKTEGTLTGGKLALTLNSTFKKGTHSAEIVFPGGPGALPTTVTKSFSISG